ncbi:hypothetical protein GCM10022393_27160 [Aquimarina addita]|uniref:histidine kinase n=1 Tax=Aquimarina addita TaxID=870485 RepID=A0ABP6UMH1_9FLAO
MFFIAFQKRKNKLLLKSFKDQQRFEDALFKSKIEIQEQTLKNVSWELHDNIGQLLSTAVMQINMLNTNLDPELANSIQDVRSLVGDSLQEIRNLSKTLNNEVIQNIGLKESIQVELTRFEKLNFLKTKFSVTGDKTDLHPKDEIIVYRIIQEFFSNTIKYSQASSLEIKIEYQIKNLIISIKDDGIGFSKKNAKAGSGLLNMASRSDLINAKFEYETAPGEGVSLRLTYPFKSNNEDIKNNELG